MKPSKELMAPKTSPVSGGKTPPPPVVKAKSEKDVTLPPPPPTPAVKGKKNNMASPAESTMKTKETYQGPAQPPSPVSGTVSSPPPAPDVKATASPEATPIAGSIKKTESSSLASQAMSPPPLQRIHSRRRKESTESIPPPPPPPGTHLQPTSPKGKRDKDRENWHLFIRQVHCGIFLFLMVLAVIAGSGPPDVAGSESVAPDVGGTVPKSGAADVGGTVSESGAASVGGTVPKSGAADVGGTVSVSHLVVINLVIDNRFIYIRPYLQCLALYIQLLVISELRCKPDSPNRPRLDIAAVSAGLISMDVAMYYTLANFSTLIWGAITGAFVMWGLFTRYPRTGTQLA